MKKLLFAGLMLFSLNVGQVDAGLGRSLQTLSRQAQQTFRQPSVAIFFVPIHHIYASTQPGFPTEFSKKPFTISCLKDLYDLKSNLLEHVTVLNLSSEGINDREIQKITPRLMDMPHLNILNLAYNEIQDRGIKTLGPAIKTHSHLTKLIMHNNEIGFDGIRQFALELDNQKLELLDLSHNENIKHFKVIEYNVDPIFLGLTLYGLSCFALLYGSSTCILCFGAGTAILLECRNVNKWTEIVTLSHKEQQIIRKIIERTVPGCKVIL